MKKILMVILVAVAACASGAPVRSMLGAHGSINEVTEGEKWVNPYVTDGLIAMWDGEWNAGGGMHDNNATVWKDLSGNGYDLILNTTGVSFVRNGLRCSSQKNGGYAWAETSTDYHTIEICLSFKNFTINWKQSIFMTSSRAYRIMYYIPAEQGIQFGYQNSLIRPPDYIPEKPYYFAAAYEDGNNAVALYSNGILTASSTYTESWGIPLKMGIGRYGTSYPYIGTIFAIRLYSRILTADEIAYNYAIDKERFNLP